MTASQLREEIDIELEAMELIVEELNSLRQDLESREPSVREKTAAAAFLSQFYNGLENILKRITYYHNVPLPEGENWHVELFQRFSTNTKFGLPQIFDDEFAAEVSPYRRFRHVAFHGYGFNIEWSRMKEGVENIGRIFDEFKLRIAKYLPNLDSSIS